MFFQSWASIAATAVTGVCAYVALVVMVRLSGKRTLAKMNAFDLVVTVALGSTLSTVFVSREVPLSDGVVALALLVALQFAVAWTSVRWPAFEHVVKSEPSLLVFRGQIRAAELRRQRVSEDEVGAAVRSAGLPQMSDAGAVVLETDGSFSVIPAYALPAGAAIEGLGTSQQR